MFNPHQKLNEFKGKAAGGFNVLWSAMHFQFIGEQPCASNFQRPTKRSWLASSAICNWPWEEVRLLILANGRHGIKFSVFWSAAGHNPAKNSILTGSNTKLCPSWEHKTKAILIFKCKTLPKITFPLGGVMHVQENSWMTSDLVIDWLKMIGGQDRAQCWHGGQCWCLTHPAATAPMWWRHDFPATTWTSLWCRAVWPRYYNSWTCV